MDDVKRSSEPITTRAEKEAYLCRHRIGPFRSLKAGPKLKNKEAEAGINELADTLKNSDCLTVGE